MVSKDHEYPVPSSQFRDRLLPCAHDEGGIPRYYARYSALWKGVPRGEIF